VVCLFFVHWLSLAKTILPFCGGYSSSHPLSKSSEEADLILIVARMAGLVDKKGKNHIFLSPLIRIAPLIEVNLSVLFIFSAKEAVVPLINIISKTLYFIREGSVIAWGVHKKTQ
jgi:hypothetical protein